MSALFVYLMTYGGALASLVDPFVGLMVYISFSIIKPELMWPWSVPEGNYSRIVAVALLAGWTIRGFGRWNFGRGKAVIAAMLGFFGWTILSAAQAPNQTLAWEFVEHFAKIVLPIVVGITTIKSVKQLKVLAWVILLSQAFPAFELNQYYLSGYNKLWLEGFGGMDNNCYAISLVTCTGLGCFLFWYSERRWQKAIALASVAFMVHAILFSFSRGGMLGLVVMALAGFAVMPKGPKEYLAFTLAVAVGLGLAGDNVRKRFQSSFAEQGERDSSAESRLQLWSACCDCMAKHPLFGLGPEGFPLVSHEYGFKAGKESHTLWLNVGAELGIPAMLLLIYYYGICVVRLVPIARGKTAVADPWIAYLARAVIAALCGFALSAQFVALDFLEVPYYVGLLGAGILAFSSRRFPSVVGHAVTG